MATEFHLIDQFFHRANNSRREGVILAIGDDCAITKLPPQCQLAITTDTMVENVHFFPNIAPQDLAYKAVASNLSDLAAQGAKPAWISLALTMPKVDENWLQQFSAGLFELLDEHQVALIGGDTTQGSLRVVTITAHGILKNNTALFRHKAQVGDFIYVSGTLGDSLAGLYLLQQGKSDLTDGEQFLLQRHLRPTPRVKLGQWLVGNGFSQCALDLSDGLMGDLKHICEKSHVSAVLNLADLPCSQALEAVYGREDAEKMALQGGEDYELCFTVSASVNQAFQQALVELDVSCTCIGRIIEKQHQAEILLQRNGNPVEISVQSFEHFA